MGEHVNRETIERRCDRLLEEYEPVEFHEEETTIDPEEFADLREIAEEGYLGGGYAWVVREPEQAAELTPSMPDDLDETERVLLIMGRGSNRWGVAGGGREADETFEEAAVREVAEETGVDCEITDCFLLVHRISRPENEGNDEVHLLYAFFDAEYAGGHVEIQPGELNGAAWFADPRSGCTHRPSFDPTPSGTTTTSRIPSRSTASDAVYGHILRTLDPFVTTVSIGT